MQFQINVGVIRWKSPMPPSKKFSLIFLHLIILYINMLLWVMLKGSKLQIKLTIILILVMMIKCRSSCS